MRKIIVPAMMNSFYRLLKKTLIDQGAAARFLLLIILGIGVAGCEPITPSQNLIEEIQRRGELRVLTRQAPTTYFVGPEGPAGLEYDMVEAFAATLGVKTRYIIENNFAQLLQRIEVGEADIAAAGITLTLDRQARFLFGPAYHYVSQQVVCLRGQKLPRSVADLVDLQLTVLAGSSYEERLLGHKLEWPELDWKTEADLEAEVLLELVSQGEIDCTVADSNLVQVHRRYFPNLTVAFNLGPVERLAWAMPMSATQLRLAIESWFEEYQASRQLETVHERYYGYFESFDYVDIRRFRRRIRSRLPNFQKTFLEAAEANGFSWTLLAAQGYRESFWDPLARSYTGVRGLMMLTQQTAREMGVNNRLDPEQSIRGGAEYLSGLYKRLPEEIREPDRTWIALSAYNVGFNHVLDAFALARKLNKNPYLWADLSQVLPLLSDKRFYADLPNGYARGHEPVRYVQRIREFKNILDQQFSEQ